MDIGFEDGLSRGPLAGFFKGSLPIPSIGQALEEVWQFLRQSLTLEYNAKKKNTITLLMCTQREILQNDLLRSAKLGPWQKEKQQLKMGVLFHFFGIFRCFSLCSFFSTGQIRVRSLSHEG